MHECSRISLLIQRKGNMKKLTKINDWSIRKELEIRHPAIPAQFIYAELIILRTVKN